MIITKISSILRMPKSKNFVFGTANGVYVMSSNFRRIKQHLFNGMKVKQLTLLNADEFICSIAVNSKATSQ